MRSAKYAPLGYRGMFGGRRSYGETDYFQKANNETIVVVLIEEMVAVQNLGQILTVDHIDVFFVAPSDLAQTMGYIGNHTHPAVQKVIDEAITQIVQAGRTAGTLVNDDNVARYLDLGVRFVMNSWTGWVAKGATAYLKQVAAKAAPVLR